MKLRAVAFDIDGTLYPSYKMYLHSIIFFLRYSYFIYQFARIRKEIRTKIYQNNFREIQARLLAKRLKIPEQLTYDKIQKIIYTEWPAVFKNIRVYPYLVENLEMLQRNRIKLAILSDFPVRPKLDYLGISGYWDCAFSSEDIGYLKPCDKAFHALCEKLALKPAEILYVGDRYKYDIEGAKKAGLKTAYLSGTPGRKKMADFQFKSYKNFTSRVLSFFN